MQYKYFLKTQTKCQTFYLLFLILYEKIGLFVMQQKCLDLTRTKKVEFFRFIHTRLLEGVLCVHFFVFRYSVCKWNYLLESCNFASENVYVDFIILWISYLHAWMNQFLSWKSACAHLLAIIQHVSNKALKRRVYMLAGTRNDLFL